MTREQGSECDTRARQIRHRYDLGKIIYIKYYTRARVCFSFNVTLVARSLILKLVFGS